MPNESRRDFDDPRGTQIPLEVAVWRTTWGAIQIARGGSLRASELDRETAPRIESSRLDCADRARGLEARVGT